MANYFYFTEFLKAKVHICEDTMKGNVDANYIMHYEYLQVGGVNDLELAVIAM